MIDKEQLKARLDASRIKNLQGYKSNNYPSNTQMVKNLGNSLVRNIKSVASGNSLNENDEQAKKLNEVLEKQKEDEQEEYLDKDGIVGVVY